MVHIPHPSSQLSKMVKSPGRKFHSKHLKTVCLTLDTSRDLVKSLFPHVFRCHLRCLSPLSPAYTAFGGCVLQSPLVGLHFQSWFPPCPFYVFFIFLSAVSGFVPRFCLTGESGITVRYTCNHSLLLGPSLHSTKARRQI